MNTIYKVIWSRAKHCYVVASELAKSCTKSASGRKKAAIRTVTALTLVGLLAGAGAGVAQAEETIYEGNYSASWATKGNISTFVGDDNNTLLVDHSSNTTINAPAFGVMTDGTINFGVADNPLANVTVKQSEGVYWTGYIYNGEVNVNADTYKQEGSIHGIYVIGTSDGSEEKASTLNMNVKHFESTTAATAIHTREGTNAVANIGSADNPLESFSATRTSSEGGVALLQVNEGSTLNIYADKVTLKDEGKGQSGTSNNQNGGGVLGTGTYGTANIVADEVEITGDINLRYGGVNNNGETASFNIETDKLTMNGDILLGGGNSDGDATSNFSRNTTLNLDVSESATITGDIIVNGNTSTDKTTSDDENLVNLNFDGDSTISGTITVDGKTASDGDAGVSITGNGTVTVKNEDGDTNAIEVKGDGGSLTVGSEDGSDTTTLESKGDISITDGGSMSVEENAGVDAGENKITVSGNKSSLKTAKRSKTTAQTIAFSKGAADNSELLGDVDAQITGVSNLEKLLGINTETSSHHTFTRSDNNYKTIISAREDGGFDFFYYTDKSKDNSGNVKKVNLADFDGEGNFTAYGDITGEDAYLDDVYAEDIYGDSITVDSASIGDVQIEDGYISGLQEVEYSAETANYAATVGQVAKAKTVVTVNDNDEANVTEGNLLLTVTEDETDGHTIYNVKLNNTLDLTEDGSLTIGGSELTANTLKVGDKFSVNSEGSIKAAGGNFKVGSAGHVTTNGNITAAGALTADNERFKAENGNVYVKDATGNQKIVLWNDGSMKAASGKFQVSDTGAVTATSGKIGGVSVSEAANGHSTINGVEAVDLFDDSGKAITANANYAATVGQLQAIAEEIDSDYVAWDQDNTGKAIVGQIKGVTLNEGNVKADSANIGKLAIDSTGWHGNTKIYTSDGSSFSIGGDGETNGGHIGIFSASESGIKKNAVALNGLIVQAEDENGKSVISNVADGELSATSYQAVNGRQLYAVDQKVGKATFTDAKNISTAKDLTEAVTTLDGKLGNVSDLNDDLGDDLTSAVNEAYKVAQKHTTLTEKASTEKDHQNLIVKENGTDGQKNYDVSLNSDLELDSVKMSAGEGSASQYAKLDKTGLELHDGTGSSKYLVNGIHIGLTDTTKDIYDTELTRDTLKVDGKTYITSAGINANNQVITNVANGVADNDAVNVSQLNGVKTLAAKHTNAYAKDSNITVTNRAEAGEAANYEIALAKDISLGSDGSLTIGSATVTNSGFAVGDSSLKSDSLTVGKSFSVGSNGELSAAGGKFYVGSDGSISAVNNITTSDNGFKVRANGYVEAAKGKFKVATTGDVTANSYVTGDSALKSDSLTVGKNFSVDSTGHVQANGGIAVNNQKITNLANGTEDSDAVNYGQLKSVEATAKKHTTLKVANSNLKLLETNTDGQLEYLLALGDQITLGSTSSAGTITVTNGTSSAMMTATGFAVGNASLTSDALTVGKNFAVDTNGDVTGNSFTAGKSALKSDSLTVGENFSVDSTGRVQANGGIAVNSQKITNLAKGTESTDAVNKGQLDEVSNRVTAVEGRVTTLESDMEKAKSDISNLQSDMTQAKTDIKANSDKIAALETTASETTEKLNKEISDREAAVSAEAKAREDADAAINAKVGEATFTGANYISDATDLTDASMKLDKQVKTNSDGISSINTKLGTSTFTNGATTYGDAINANTDAINANAAGIQQNALSIHELGREVDSVGAISAALAGLHPLDYDGTDSKWQLSAAVGSYDGSSALAMGGFYHVNEDVMLSGGVSTILKGERKTAMNMGVTFRVGQGGTKIAKADATELAAKNQALEEKVAAQDQRLEELEAKLEALLSAQAK